MEVNGHSARTRSPDGTAPTTALAPAPATCRWLRYRGDPWRVAGLHDVALQYRVDAVRCHHQISLSMLVVGELDDGAIGVLTETHTPAPSQLTGSPGGDIGETRCWQPGMTDKELRPMYSS